jgi:hypothetical protein
MGWYFISGEDIGKVCEICLQPFKEKEKFYMHESHNDDKIKNPKLTHALCEWEQEEKRQSEMRKGA